MFPVGNYLILYRPIEAGVEIVRVLHGARQWRDLLWRRSRAFVTTFVPSDFRGTEEPPLFFMS